MLRRAEEHAARNAPPTDPAVPHHEAEVKKRDRQKDHDRRADTGVVLLPPKGDANMEDSVRENEAPRCESRPKEAPVSPDGGEKRKPDEERIGAIDREGSELEPARSSDIVDHGPGVGDEEVGAAQKVDAVLFKLMHEIGNE